MNNPFLIFVLSIFICLILGILFTIKLQKRDENQAKSLLVINYILLGLFLPILVIHISTIFYDLLEKPAPIILIWIEMILFPLYLITLGLHIWFNRNYFTEEDY